MTYLLAICLTCAGDLDASKWPDTCEAETVYAESWADALDYARELPGVVSVYLLDEEDGVWTRRTSATAWCELPD